LAVLVHGEAGVGVTRFIKEVFYQCIHKHPKNRDKIMQAIPRILKFISILLLLAILALTAFVATFDANNYNCTLILD